VIDPTVTDQTFRSCAFLQNLPALHRRFSGFLSPRKPHPSLQPGGLVQVGACCSLGTLGPPRLSLRKKPPRGHLHLSGPLSFFRFTSLSTREPANLRGLKSPPARHFPRKGAGLPDLLDPDTTNLLEPRTRHCLFFQLKVSRFLRTGTSLST